MREDIGTRGGEDRISVSHDSVFGVIFSFLSFTVIGSLSLGFRGGGSMQLEFVFFSSGSWFFL